MRDDGRLAVSVELPDGAVKRWAPDEVDHGDIPNDLGFSTSAPGGHKAGGTSLIRGLAPRADEGLFATVRFYGPGNQTAFEGRIEQLPRQTTGRAATLNPQIVGWSAHLEDDQTFMQVYVDQDLGRWGDPSLARRILVATSGANLQGGVGVNGLTWDVPESVPSDDHTERVYACPAGVKVSNVMYKGARTGAFTNFEAAKLFASDDPDFSPADDYALTLDDTVRLQSLTTAARRYVLLRTKTTAAVGPGLTGHQQRYTKVAVYGDHGVTTHSISGEPDGVYASDVIADILDTAAPLLTYTTGSDGTIQPTTFEIPQLAFYDPTSAADAIARTNAYHGHDWFVWDDRTFYYQPAGTGTQWQARLADGAQLALEGDTAGQILNGIVITYTQAGSGEIKRAGPVGSGMDVESAYLEETSDTNPATSHGITRKWAHQQLSVVTTDAGAVEIGAVLLTEMNLAARRGQVTLRGSVRHPTEGLVPVWRVRAGDTITLTDRPGDAPRRIIGTSYSHNERTVTCDLDSTPHRADALMERLIAVTGALNL